MHLIIYGPQKAKGEEDKLYIRQFIFMSCEKVGQCLNQKTKDASNQNQTMHLHDLYIIKNIANAYRMQ